MPGILTAPDASVNRGLTVGHREVPRVRGRSHGGGGLQTPVRYFFWLRAFGSLGALGSFGGSPAT